MVSQQKQRGRRGGIAASCIQVAFVVFNACLFFQLAGLSKMQHYSILPPSSSTQTNEKAFLSFFCYYCICDKKEDGSKRDFFNGLTLVVVLASGDADVAGFKVPFRIRAGIWTEIKVFSQDVTFGKVIATAKRKP